MIWLLIALFSLINLSSIVDIIYSKKYIIFSKKDNAEKTEFMSEAGVP